MTKLDELVTALEASRKALRDHGRSALAEAFWEFFGTYPEAERIVWTQYTPHFNDGEACVFSVNDWECHGDGEAFGVKPSMPDEDDRQYGYGEYGVIAALQAVEANDSNRSSRRWYQQNRPELAAAKAPLRALTDREAALIRDFERLQGQYKTLGEVARDTIGDHALVVVTRKGIEIEEYDHD